jgi:hypothetical protein
MSNQWETFCDVGYYHMWRLRRKNERGWNDGFHINTRDEAQALCQLLNKLEREVERERALANEAIATWKKTREERDEAREYADKLAQGLPDGMLPKDIEVLREANLGLATEVAAVTEQRDRLAAIARELTAMIRVNVMWGRFSECTIEQIDEYLKPWNEKIAAVKGGSDE